jgi:hypothetical protein
VNPSLPAEAADEALPGMSSPQRPSIELRSSAAKLVEDCDV